MRARLAKLGFIQITDTACILSTTGTPLLLRCNAMPPEVRIIGIEGMPEFKDGDDLAGSMMDAASPKVHRFKSPISL